MSRSWLFVKTYHDLKDGTFMFRRSRFFHSSLFHIYPQDIVCWCLLCFFKCHGFFVPLPSALSKVQLSDVRNASRSARCLKNWRHFWKFWRRWKRCTWGILTFFFSLPGDKNIYKVGNHISTSRDGDLVLWDVFFCKVSTQEIIHIHIWYFKYDSHLFLPKYLFHESRQCLECWLLVFPAFSSYQLWKKRWTFGTL